MKVKVEQGHIDKGIRSDGQFCPLALAIQDIRPSDKQVISVGSHYVNFLRDEEGIKDNNLVSKLSDEAVTFVSTFDIGAVKVEPVELEIEEPHYITRAEYIEKVMMLPPTLTY